MAKVRATFNLAKLSKKIDIRIATGLNIAMNHLNKEIQENLEAGKDINDNTYDTLSPSTQKQRDNNWGYYKKSGSGGTLNWSGTMRKTKKTPAKPGHPVAKLEMVGTRKGKHYGAYHNKGGPNLPKREWFGMTKSMKPGGSQIKKAMAIIGLGIRRDWKK